MKDDDHGIETEVATGFTGLITKNPPPMCTLNLRNSEWKFSIQRLCRVSSISSMELLAVRR